MGRIAKSNNNLNKWSSLNSVLTAGLQAQQATPTSPKVRQTPTIRQAETLAPAGAWNDGLARVAQRIGKPSFHSRLTRKQESLILMLAAAYLLDSPGQL